MPLVAVPPAFSEQLFVVPLWVLHCEIQVSPAGLSLASICAYGALIQMGPGSDSWLCLSLAGDPGIASWCRWRALAEQECMGRLLGRHSPGIRRPPGCLGAVVADRESNRTRSTRN